jgi:hypothetical protein
MFHLATRIRNGKALTNEQKTIYMKAQQHRQAARRRGIYEGEGIAQDPFQEPSHKHTDATDAEHGAKPTPNRVREKLRVAPNLRLHCRTRATEMKFSNCSRFSVE